MSSLPSSIDETLESVTGKSTTELKQDAAEAAKKSVSSLRDFVAGGVGGVFCVVAGHPFDLVKVRLQTAEKGVYNGAIDVVRKTVAREGMFRGLYAGVSAPLAGVTPMFAINFWGYGVGKQLVSNFSTVTNNQFSVAQTSAAGFFSAIPMTVVTAPFERVKIILQIQGQKELKPGEKPKYNGGVDVVKQLYKEGGFKSVFRGSAMTLARDGPGSAVYFATYETVKRSLTPKTTTGEPAQLSLLAVCGAGAAAGIAMWIPVFPVDTVKSRMQSASGNLSIMDTVREISGRGGLRAFYPGFAPAIARAGPASAATFLGVELAHLAMNKMF